MNRLRAYTEYLLYVGLIFVLVPLAVYAVRRQFTIPGQIILVVGFLALGLYAGLEYQRIIQALTGRQMRYGSNVVLMTVLFIGIVGVIDFMSLRYTKRIDLTANRSFSISEQTAKILDNLEQPVKATAFFVQGGYGREDLETLFKSYASRGRGKFSYEFIDPDAMPTLARQYGLEEGEGSVTVLEYGDRRQKVTGSTESDITSAILKISRDVAKTVYVLQGHGELTPEDTSQQGFSLAKQAMERDNYTVKLLNLSIGPTATVTTTLGLSVPPFLTPTAGTYRSIPADAAAIVIAGPQTPIAEAEWKILSEWLDNGGKLFVLLDALDPSTGLEDALEETWGVRVNDDLVIDLAGAYLGDPGTLVISRGSFSPITKDLRTQIVLPGARSIKLVENPPAGVVHTTLAETSEQSWGETDLANLARGISFDPNTDSRGPCVLGVSAEKDTAGGAKARLVVYGNARVATDRWLQTGSNLEFVVNAVNWLTEDEQLISIRPRPAESRSMFIPPTEGTLVVLGTVIGMPLAVLLVGGIVWLRRR